MYLKLSSGCLFSKDSAVTSYQFDFRKLIFLKYFNIKSNTDFSDNLTTYSTCSLSFSYMHLFYIFYWLVLWRYMLSRGPDRTSYVLLQDDHVNISRRRIPRMFTYHLMFRSIFIYYANFISFTITILQMTSIWFIFK